MRRRMRVSLAAWLMSMTNKESVCAQTTPTVVGMAVICGSSAVAKQKMEQVVLAASAAKVKVTLQFCAAKSIFVLRRGVSAVNRPCLSWMAVGRVMVEALKMPLSSPMTMNPFMLVMVAGSTMLLSPEVGLARVSEGVVKICMSCVCICTKEGSWLLLVVEVITVVAKELRDSALRMLVLVGSDPWLQSGRMQNPQTQLAEESGWLVMREEELGQKRKGVLPQQDMASVMTRGQGRMKLVAREQARLLYWAQESELRKVTETFIRYAPQLLEVKVLVCASEMRPIWLTQKYLKRYCVVDLRLQRVLVMTCMVVACVMPQTTALASRGSVKLVRSPLRAETILAWKSTAWLVRREGQMPRPQQIVAAALHCRVKVAVLVRSIGVAREVAVGKLLKVVALTRVNWMLRMGLQQGALGPLKEILAVTMLPAVRLPLCCTTKYTLPSSEVGSSCFVERSVLRVSWGEEKVMERVRAARGRQLMASIMRGRVLPPRGRVQERELVRRVQGVFWTTRVRGGMLAQRLSVLLENCRVQSPGERELAAMRRQVVGLPRVVERVVEKLKLVELCVRRVRRRLALKLAGQMLCLSSITPAQQAVWMTMTALGTVVSCMSESETVMEQQIQRRSMRRGLEMRVSAAERSLKEQQVQQFQPASEQNSLKEYSLSLPLGMVEGAERVKERVQRVAVVGETVIFNMRCEMKMLVVAKLMLWPCCVRLQVMVVARAISWEQLEGSRTQRKLPPLKMRVSGDWKLMVMVCATLIQTLVVDTLRIVMILVVDTAWRALALSRMVVLAMTPLFLSLSASAIKAMYLIALMLLTLGWSTLQTSMWKGVLAGRTLLFQTSNCQGATRVQQVKRASVSMMVVSRVQHSTKPSLSRRLLNAMWKSMQNLELVSRGWLQVTWKEQRLLLPSVLNLFLLMVTVRVPRGVPRKVVGRVKEGAVCIVLPLSIHVRVMGVERELGVVAPQQVILKVSALGLLIQVLGERVARGRVMENVLQRKESALDQYMRHLRLPLLQAVSATSLMKPKLNWKVDERQKVSLKELGPAPKVRLKGELTLLEREEVVKEARAATDPELVRPTVKLLEHVQQVVRVVQALPKGVKSVLICCGRQTVRTQFAALDRALGIVAQRFSQRQVTVRVDVPVQVRVITTEVLLMTCALQLRELIEQSQREIGAKLLVPIVEGGMAKFTLKEGYPEQDFETTICGTLRVKVARWVPVVEGLYWFSLEVVQERMRVLMGVVYFLQEARRPLCNENPMARTDLSGNALVKTVGYCGLRKLMLAAEMVVSKVVSMGQKETQIHC